MRCVSHATYWLVTARHFIARESLSCRYARSFERAPPRDEIIERRLRLASKRASVSRYPDPSGEEVENVDPSRRQNRKETELNLEALRVDERKGKGPPGQAPNDILGNRVAIADPKVNTCAPVWRSTPMPGPARKSR